MDKKILLTGLAFGFLAIILGAFGAHALKKLVQPEQLNSFEVGVRYMMYHALFLVFLGSTLTLLPEQKQLIYHLIWIGTVLFSGSIFLLSTASATGLQLKFLGPITPLGGLLLIVAWGYTFYTFLTKKA